MRKPITILLGLLAACPGDAPASANCADRPIQAVVPSAPGGIFGVMG